jgi:homopolymeric O-antigen transport system ATP-binding protein
MSIVITADRLSKRYHLGLGDVQLQNLRDAIARGLRRPGQTLRRWVGADKSPEIDWIWALRDVSFEVEEGEVLAVIGPNGAGKSTLLKILSRVTDPTEGTARIRGRLSSLLEVGTGFHPELTGRENIYLNGTILGMRKTEIDARFDEIVAFADLARFLDTPVKRYSSGMYVRLAFAIGAHLDPEILIVDEVLAVGDLAFQRKCLGKMGEVSRQGRTVLFVSHNMAAVEHLCRSGLVLQHGTVAFRGTARDAIDHYVRAGAVTPDDPRSHAVDLAVAPRRPALERPLLRTLELFTSGDRPLHGTLAVGAPFEARIHFVLDRPAVGLAVIIRFDNLLGQRILVTNSAFDPDLASEELSGERTIACEIPSLTLMPGDYKLRVALAIGNTEADAVDDAARLTVVPGDYYGTGKLPQSGAFVLAQRWRFR